MDTQTGLNKLLKAAYQPKNTGPVAVLVCDNVPTLQ